MEKIDASLELHTMRKEIQREIADSMDLNRDSRQHPMLHQLSNSTLLLYLYRPVS